MPWYFEHSKLLGIVQTTFSLEQGADFMPQDAIYCVISM